MPTTDPSLNRPPNSTRVRVDVARKWGWLCICVICLASASPNYILNLIGLSWLGACCVTIGILFLFAALVGYIGGRLKTWSMTVTGTLAMALLPYLGDHVYRQLAHLNPSSSPIDRSTVLLTSIYFIYLLAIAAVVHQTTATRPRPIRTGFCRQCKYDLTGNVSGRCSECGTPIMHDQSKTNTDS